MQGEAGLMALNGEPGQSPLKFGIAAVDLFTGQYAAQAVLAALFSRSRTGQGSHIELALYDCGIALSSYYGLEALALGRDPPKHGNAHPSIVPYGVFQASDGPIILTVGNNAQFRRFCDFVIFRPDLANDPRFATNLERSRNRSALLPEINAEILKYARAHLLTNMAKHNIPSGEVLELYEALSSRRAKTSGLIIDSPDEKGRSTVLAPPYRIDRRRLPVRSMPPTIGEGSQEILVERLGFEQQNIARLRAEGIIG